MEKVPSIISVMFHSKMYVGRDEVFL